MKASGHKERPERVRPYRKGERNEGDSIEGTTEGKETSIQQEKEGHMGTDLPLLQ